MTYIPNLDPSDTYLNYQRPLGYIDITAAAVAAGLDEIELLERLLAKNFKVYLDFEPYRGQEALRDHILKKLKDGGFDGKIGTMRGKLSYKGLKSRSTIKNGVHPLTQAGLKLLIHRVKAGNEGEDLFAGLSLLTPEAAEIANEVGGNGGQIHVLLEAPLFIGHKSFYPHVLIRIQDLDEAMSNPDPDCYDSVEKAWSSRNASEIFAPHSFPFKFFSRGSYIDSDKEQRLGVLCKDWSIQLKEVREAGQIDKLRVDNQGGQPKIEEQTPQPFPERRSKRARPKPRKPHTVFIDLSIQNGCRSWITVWGKFKNLNDNQWHQYGEFTFQVRKGPPKYKRGWLAIESDDGIKYGLSPNTFFKAFSRFIEKKM